MPELKTAINMAAGQWTVHQKEAAARVVKNLVEGAPAYQQKQLKGGLMRNAPSAIQHGAAFTDTLEKWIKDGFVAGPFLSPPLPEFRANTIMAIEQKDKVRPVLNMSCPEGNSYNDNVDEQAVPKVKMSSARQFGQAVLRAGEGALMSKLDMKDAYKNVPAKVEDYRLQGMQWLGAYFVDTQLIFGASPAVANYDNLGGTTMDVAATGCQIPRHLVHRILDDTACVAPAETGWCQQFTKRYTEICAKIGVKLAEECPYQEKAFTNKTRGTVLGVQFDTTTLQWRIADDKAARILADIHTMAHGGHADLKQVEILAGRLSDFGQMCPFLQAFKRPLNDLLSSFNENYNILLEIKEELIQDLRVWAAVITRANGWLPIALEMKNPPLGSWEFVSDAAGGLGSDDWVGVASLGTNSSGNFWFLCRGEWPPAILEGLDEKGARFASKMTTLELIGLFLPFLSMPVQLAGRNIILGVDNVSVVFGWENKSVSGDLTASALIRALHLVASFLECRIFVRHVPRLSSLASIMADSLTRSSTAKAEVWATLVGAQQYEQPEPLWEWLHNPQPDWNLGYRLVAWIKEKFSYE